MNDWRFEAHPGESEEEFVFEVRRPRTGGRGSSRPARRPAPRKPFPRRGPRPYGFGWRPGVAVDVTVNEPPAEQEPQAGTSSSTATPPSSFDPGTVSRPCPQKAGTAKDRCSSPRPCPALPDLRCVTQVAGVPFHYVEAVGRNGASGLRKVTKRQEKRTQRLVPRALTALEKFVQNARSFGLPFDTILTLGSLYCRCVKGSNPPALSNHSFGDAIDVAGVRWGSGGPASKVPETIVHNWDNPEQRVLLRRLNACLRLSFATVIDYHRPDHRDHFHCDTNQGRGRITRGLATLRFVQEALGVVLGRKIAITGKLDEATRKALLDYSKQGPDLLKNDRQLDQVFDQLFREVAAGRAGATAGAPSKEMGEVPGVLSTNDFIDPRIDVDAQRALMSMAASSNLAQVTAAFNILALVKAGSLGGIHKPDQRVPALLVRSRGGNWWETIRPGTNARLLCQSIGRSLLVFRKNLSRQELIAVLMALDAMGPGILTFCS